MIGPTTLFVVLWKKISLCLIENKILSEYRTGWEGEQTKKGRRKAGALGKSI